MKKIIKCTLALLLCVTQIFLWTDTISAAETMQSKDYTFYGYTSEEIGKSISSIRNDSYWGQHIFVTDAQTQGVKVEWKAAIRNMRVEIPKEISLYGAHAVFSDLTVSGNSKLAFMVTKRQQYSDYVTSTDHNTLAYLPFALSVDFVTGKVMCHPSKAYTIVDKEILSYEVYQSDNLKAANLADRQWGLRFDKVDDDNWQITLAGEVFIVPEEYIMLESSEMDLSKCYLALNAWDLTTNTMSVVINSCHSGENACADDPANKNILQAAADTVAYIDGVTKITYDMGTEITDMYKRYNNMTPIMQSLITNSDRLEEIYSVYSVIKKIHDIGTVTLSSEKKINQAYDAFAALPDKLKLEVSNMKEFTVAKEKYLKLKLEEEVSKPDEIKYIYKDRVKTNKLEDVTETKEVDGGMKVIKVNKDIITEGSDGTQYLWIVFTAMGVVLLAVLATFLLLHRKDKRKGLQSNE